MAVLGVDGWRGRWVGALLDGRRVTLLDLTDATAVLAVPDVAVVAIDMPIGLSEDGVRACDVEARRRLGRAGSSVFPAPLRQVLGATDYLDACRRAVEASGKALSKQAWNLVPASRSRDDALVAAVEREPVKAYVPGWPWTPVARLLRVLPLSIVRRLTGS